MSETIAYRVPGMSCAHCAAAVSAELGSETGVASILVDLETKLVTIAGEGLDDAALRAAIGEAGYEAE
jgi:copper chaperone CopZ